MHEPAQALSRGIKNPTALTLVVIAAAIFGTFVVESGSSSAFSRGAGDVPRASIAATAPGSPTAPAGVDERPGVPGMVPLQGGRRVTKEDGALPQGVTVFDDQYPGVANLDPELLRALRDAARLAAADGIELTVRSGWRSARFQDQLLREAISKYGSAEEAARWVATGETSPHVSGNAVDIGSSAATAWLSAHGAGFGLCQIYRNEPWHFELRPGAIDGGCPPMYADPTDDPRLQP